jgi:pimeloyl-ACP methyl ester carboxylesterase
VALSRWILGLVFSIFFGAISIIWFRAPIEPTKLWASPSSPQFLEVDGVGRIAYWRVEPTTPNPNPVPILYLEGGPGIGINNIRIMQISREFPEFTIYFIDQIGTGKSDRLPISAVTLKNSIKAIETFSNEVVREPVLVVGESWGTAIGARFAVQHPDLVRALLLVSPGRLPTVCAASTKGPNRVCYETKLPTINASILPYPLQRQATATVPKASFSPAAPTRIPNGHYSPVLNRVWIADKVESLSPAFSAWLVPYSTRGKWDTSGASVSVNRRLRKLHTQKTLTANPQAVKIPALILRGSLDFIELDRIGSYQTLFTDARFVELKNETHSISTEACAYIMETRLFLASTVNSPKPKSCSNLLVPHSEIKGGYSLKADVRF